eukprot:2317997-Rhodomonas_salina.1
MPVSVVVLQLGVGSWQHPTFTTRDRMANAQREGMQGTSLEKTLDDSRQVLSTSSCEMQGRVLPRSWKRNDLGHSATCSRKSVD